MLRIVSSLIFLVLTGMSAAHAIDVNEMRAALSENPRGCHPDMAYAGRWDVNTCPQECGDPGLQGYKCKKGDPHWRGPEPACRKQAEEYNQVREQYNSLVDFCSNRPRSESKFPPNPALDSSSDLSTRKANQRKTTSEAIKKQDTVKENKEVSDDEDAFEDNDKIRIAPQLAKCEEQKSSCDRDCAPAPPPGIRPSFTRNIRNVCLDYCQGVGEYCRGSLLTQTPNNADFQTKLNDQLELKLSKIESLYKDLNEQIHQQNDRLAAERAAAEQEYFRQVMGGVIEGLFGGQSNYPAYRNNAAPSRTYVSPQPAPRSGGNGSASTRSGYSGGSGGSSCRYQSAGNC